MLTQYVIIRRQPPQTSFYKSPQIAFKALLPMSAPLHLWEDGADQALCPHVGGAWSRGVVCTHRAWVLSWL